MDRAETLYDKESYDEAETLAELAVEANVESDRPGDVLEKIAKARDETDDDGQKIAAAGTSGSGTTASGPSPDGRDSTDEESGREADREPETDGSKGGSAEEESGSDGEDRESGISERDGKGLYDSAMKKAINGNPGGAIADCTRALRAGYTQCHRVLGSAYKQKGKTGPACRHFQQYLATDPPDASRIRNVMSSLNCE